MSMLQISEMILCLAFFVKQFYLFPSGSIGAADILFALSFFLTFAGTLKEKKLKIYKEDYLWYGFAAFVLLINGIYYVRTRNFDFIRYTMYWMFSTALIWNLRTLMSEALLAKIRLVCTANVLCQLIICISGKGRYFHELWGGSRFMGTFNDPNQCAFFIFTSILVLFLLYRRKEEPSKRESIVFWLSFLLGVYLIVKAKSTGMFVGLMAFFFILLWQWFWKQRGRSSRKWCWDLAAAALVCIGAVGLYLIWPKPDFEITETSYTLLSRIQQKIWKLANGNINDLLYDRSAERLILQPWYLLYGAGEGYFERFIPWGFESRLSPGVFHVFRINEIHCSLFDVWFSYGLIPTLLLVVWVVRNIIRCPKNQRAAILALLAESFTLMNLRQPLFWFIVTVSGIMKKDLYPPFEMRTEAKP